jgi:hypothetical protein
MPPGKTKLARSHLSKQLFLRLRGVRTLGLHFVGDLWPIVVAGPFPVNPLDPQDRCVHANHALRCWIHASVG